jgi:Mg2+ and Co2+ transporter CorA
MKLDIQKNGWISFQQFVDVIRLIKLSHLFIPQTMLQINAAEALHELLPANRDSGGGRRDDDVNGDDHDLKSHPHLSQHLRLDILSMQTGLFAVADYSPTNLRAFRPIQRVEPFLFSSKPIWASVRWINLENPDSLNLRRLAIKYQFHPLAIDDALSSDLHMAKYEEFDDHSFLVRYMTHSHTILMPYV